MAYGLLNVDAIQSSSGKQNKTEYLASTLDAIALANNVESTKVSKLETGLVEGKQYFYDEENDVTYYSIDEITDTITSLGTDVNGIRTLTGDGGTYQVKSSDKVTESQEELISGNIFPKKGVLKDGMTVPAGTTHLRTLVGGETVILVAWDTLTLPSTVTSLPVSFNEFLDFELGTDQGVFRFVSIDTNTLRQAGDISGWGADGVNDELAINRAFDDVGFAVTNRDITCENPVSPTGPNQSLKVNGTFYCSGEDAAGIGFLNLGAFGRTAMHNATYYSIDTFNSGSSDVITSTASDALNFSVDDIVFIKGGNYYTVGGEDVYEFGQLCKVKTVNGVSGVVSLVDVTDNKEPVTGGLICKVDSAVEGFVLEAHNLIATGSAQAKLIVEGGGAYKCKIDIEQDFVGDSFAFTNANYGCKYLAHSLYCERHFYELAVNSRRNLVKASYAQLTYSGDVGKRPFRTSEQSSNNIVNIPNISMNLYTANDIPIYIESSYNTFIFDKVEAKNAPLRLIQFTSQAFTPTAPETRGNTVYIGDAVCGSGDTYISTSGNELYDNHIIGKETISELAGVVSSGRAVDITGDGTTLKNIKSDYLLFLQGALTNEKVENCEFIGSLNTPSRALNSNRYKNNKFGLADEATDNNRFDGTISVTSTVPDNNLFSDTFPANSLVEGDYIDFYISGVISGTNDAKEIRIDFAGVTVCSVSYLAAESGPFVISGRIQMDSVTVETSSFNVASGGTNGAQVGGSAISDISSNSSILNFKAWKLNASDTFLIRNYQQKVVKVGQ